MKICNKCHKDKQLSEFSIRSDTGKHRGQCKKCTSLVKHEWYESNKGRVLNQNREWNKNNSEKRKLINKKWKSQNEQRNLIQNKKYRRERLKNDVSFKIEDTLRSRVGTAIRNQYGKKAFKTIELIGCSIEHFMKHLEKQFRDGMTWNNHGKNGWHIDHIKPCSSFDLSDPNQQKECFHYTNVQPLWAKDNLCKSNKL